jgi:MFS family permease
VIQVVAVSLLQNTVPSGRVRVSAFTSFGAVFPLAFLVIPIVTAAALDHLAWRWIPIGWAIAGLAMAALAQALLTVRSRPSPPGEMITPLLAGLALAACSTALVEIDNLEIESNKIVISIGVFLISGALCLILMRRSASPGFSLRPLSLPIMGALLTGVLVVSLAQILSYICIVLEYFYDLTALQAAVAILPAQAGAIVGAKIVAQFAAHRWGVERAGRWLVLANGVTMLPLVFVTTSTPIWFLIAVSTAFSCAGMGALTVLNMDVMGRAPSDSTGAVSAFRIAASTIGTALGMALVGAIILSSVQVDAGEQNVELAQLEQMSIALRVSGVVCFVIAAAGWLLLVVAERRERVQISVPAVYER